MAYEKNERMRASRFPWIAIALSVSTMACAGTMGRSGAGAEQCVAPPAGMTAWWSFDDAPGAGAADHVGGDDGTYGRNATLGEGKSGTALVLHGTGSYVWVADADALDFGTGDFTIEGWFRTESPQGTILAKVTALSGQQVGYMIMISYGWLIMQMSDEENSWRNYNAAGIERVDDGAWHHLAVSVDRDQPKGGRLYVDGAEVYTFDPTERSGSLSNSTPLRLGSGFRPFEGSLDEIALYQRALDESEIRAIHGAGSAGKCRPAEPAASTTAP